MRGERGERRGQRGEGIAGERGEGRGERGDGGEGCSAHKELDERDRELYSPHFRYDVLMC